MKKMFNAVAEVAGGAVVKQLYTISYKIASNNVIYLALLHLIILLNNYPELKLNKNVTIH